MDQLYHGNLQQKTTRLHFCQPAQKRRPPLEFLHKRLPLMRELSAKLTEGETVPAPRLRSRTPCEVVTLSCLRRGTFFQAAKESTQRSAARNRWFLDLLYPARVAGKAMIKCCTDSAPNPLSRLPLSKCRSFCPYPLLTPLSGSLLHKKELLPCGRSSFFALFTSGSSWRCGWRGCGSSRCRRS